MTWTAEGEQETETTNTLFSLTAPKVLIVDPEPDEILCNVAQLLMIVRPLRLELADKLQATPFHKLNLLLQ